MEAVLEGAGLMPWMLGGGGVPAPAGSGAPQARRRRQQKSSREIATSMLDACEELFNLFSKMEAP